MILNYPKFKKVMILLVFTVSFSTFSQTPDYNVQHIQDDVARSGGTNTTFTAVSSLNNAGAPSSVGNAEGDNKYINLISIAIKL